MRSNSLFFPSFKERLFGFLFAGEGPGFGFLVGVCDLSRESLWLQMFEFGIYMMWLGW